MSETTTATTAAAQNTASEPNLYDVFETDPQAEAEGLWVPFASSEFRVRSASSPGFQSVRTRQLKRHAPIVRANGGVLPPDVVATAEGELAAAAIMDWRNVPVPPWWDAKKFPGPTLPFSPANAQALMADKRLHRLRSSILNSAETYDTFRAAEAKAVEGNSAPVSNGSSHSASAPTP